MSRLATIVAVIMAMLCGLALAWSPARAAEGDASARKARAAEIRREAEAGDTKAEVTLGVMYALGGMGVRHSYKDAVKWWDDAASKGDARAEYYLGLLYEVGKGVGRDPRRAAELFRQAADRGDSWGMAQTGDLILFARGAARNVDAARQWYEKAAKLDNPKAEMRLGIMRLTGEGLPKDLAEGVRLVTASAEQGFGPGMNVLALLYQKGLGVPQNVTQAYIWARRAVIARYEPAVKLAAALAASMTSEQVSEADASAGNWHARPRDDAADPGGGAGEDEGEGESGIDGGAAAGHAPRHGGTAAASPPPAPGGAMRVIATGSGFYISRAGDLVTNHHVIADCERLDAGTKLDGMKQARLVADDRDNDLAVLRVAARPGSVAVLRSGAIRQAEAVLAYGFPLTGALSSDGNSTQGAITALTGLGDDTRFYQTSAPVQPGNSGGPLVDMSGKVIGVVDAKLDALRVASAIHDIPQNVNFAIKVSVVANFLDSHGISYQAAPIGEARAAPDVSDAARAFTVLIACSARR